MDQKPQRPVRVVRVHDENAVPSNPIIGKTIHQRNKSTPALSTLMQGGAVRGGVKRAAFADVSNTNRTTQPAKDDSAINGKGSYDGVKASGIHVHDLILKNTAVQKPAQRLLPLKSTTAQAVTTTIVPTKPAASDFVVSHIQPAETRKIYAKRSAPALRSAELVKQTDLPAVNEVQVDYKPAATEEALALLKGSIEPKQSSVIDGVILPQAHVEVDPITSNATAASSDAVLSAGASQPIEQETGYEHIVTESETERQILLALEQQAQALETEQKAALATTSVQSQDYYDEEDEEEMYYEDGYTTARSFKMRGDNTTGGATIVLQPKYTSKIKAELAAAKELVKSSQSQEDIDDEAWDTSMVAEYGEEIFEYMTTLENRMRPNPHYMDHQTECQWSMRAVLMDWLVQVHQRFTLLPETLFLSVNYIDRFLSCKVVSLAKLQLVGATAIFLASKYEEVNCPSIQEIVYMVDNGYTQDEILKAERFMLSMLSFELGWPGPMSFLRRVSKADDYDLETRTLAKYFLEVTIMDERFVGCVPSFTAAGAHCLARLMLRKGDWTPAHAYYSNYTYAQLRQLLAVMVECCEEPLKHHAAVYEKYQDKRYKRASLFVQTEMSNGFQLPRYGRASSTGHCGDDSWRRAM